MCGCSVTALSLEEQAVADAFFETCDPRLLELYHKFPIVFEPPEAAPPPRSVVHRIRLKEGAVPVRRSPYPLGPEKMTAMKEQVTDMAARSWVSLSLSPWGAPILFMWKKGGE